MPTLLAFTPHPDDEAYAFGGLIALAARAGWRCVLHCCTVGEAGERHDGRPLAHLGRDRRLELAESCRRLGVSTLVTWGLPDGHLASRDETGRCARLMRMLEPSLVLSLGPDGAYGHPDHLALYRWVHAAWESLESCPPLLFAAFPTGLFLPQYRKCVASGIMGDPPLLAAADVGTTAVHYRVPLASVATTKLSALGAHGSQLPGGDPHAIFPPGIVEVLLGEERYLDARDAADPATAALIDGLLARTPQ